MEEEEEDGAGQSQAQAGRWEEEAMVGGEE